MPFVMKPLSVIWLLLPCITAAGTGATSLSSLQPFTLPLEEPLLAGIEALQEREEQDAAHITSPMDLAVASTSIICILAPSAPPLNDATEAGELEGAHSGLSPQRLEERLRLATAIVALDGVCAALEATSASGYSYRVCLGEGGEVKQVGEGGNFLLGSFLSPAAVTLGMSAQQRAAAMANSNDDLTVVEFGHGDACPGSPRAATVSLLCGTTSAIITAAEPATCKYELALTHPSLCSFSSQLVPRAPSAVAAELKTSLTDALPPSLRDLLAAAARGDSSGGDGDGHASHASSAPGSSSMSAEDVPGVGGRSIGVDDRYRGSKTWRGLTPQRASEAKATAALEVHHTMYTTKRSHKGSGRSDVQEALVTCSVYMTDELRKSGGSVGVGKGSGSSAYASALGNFELSIWASGDAAGLSQLKGAVSGAARGSNRRAIGVGAAAGDPLHLVSGKQCSTSSAAAVAPNGFTCLGGMQPSLEAGSSVPADLEFVSLTLRVQSS